MVGNRAKRKSPRESLCLLTSCKAANLMSHCRCLFQPLVGTGQRQSPPHPFMPREMMSEGRDVGLQHCAHVRVVWQLGAKMDFREDVGYLGALALHSSSTFFSCCFVLSLPPYSLHANSSFYRVGLRRSLRDLASALCCSDSSDA